MLLCLFSPVTRVSLCGKASSILVTACGNEVGCSLTPLRLPLEPCGGGGGVLGGSGEGDGGGGEAIGAEYGCTTGAPGMHCQYLALLRRHP